MDFRKKIGNDNGNDDEQVEQLLQAAQDDLMLKLSVNSHMSRVSPNYLDSDLDRRFQALRSRPSSAAAAAAVPRKIQSDSSSKPPPAIENLVVDGESQSLLGDDLAVRFAALKATLPPSNTPPPSSVPNDGDSDGDEDDEVEKLIQWAKDAARLDPSPPSDEEVDDEDDESSSSDEDFDDRRKKKAV